MLAPFAPTWRRRGTAIMTQDASRQGGTRGDGYGDWPSWAVGSGAGGWASQVAWSPASATTCAELGRCSSSLSTSWAAVRSAARGAATWIQVGRAALGYTARALTVWAFNKNQRGLRGSPLRGRDGLGHQPLRARLVTHSAKHPGHEAARLRIGRDAVVPDHVLLARVVGGEGEGQVALEGVEHRAQVASLPRRCSLGVVGIAHADHRGGGRRHQLHRDPRAPL